MWVLTDQIRSKLRDFENCAELRKIVGELRKIAVELRFHFSLPCPNLSSNLTNPPILSNQSSDFAGNPKFGGNPFPVATFELDGSQLGSGKWSTIHRSDEETLRKTIILPQPPRLRSTQCNSKWSTQIWTIYFEAGTQSWANCSIASCHSDGILQGTVKS